MNRPRLLRILALVVTCCPFATGADFDYRLEWFRQVGGPAGASIFLDEFDDGSEPPSGPSGPATYFVGCAMSGVAESGGQLALTLASLCIDADETFLDGVLADAAFDIEPGIGGLIEARYSLSNGLTPLADFGIELFSFNNGMSVAIHQRPDGTILALLEAEGSGTGVVESQTDITSQMAGITDITIRLDGTSGTDFTAQIDFGADGVFDLTLPGTAPMLAGTDYRGGFIADLEAEWTDEGCSLGGVSGDPILVGEGALVTGTTGLLALSSAAPSALAGLFVAVSSVPTPFKGGTLKPVPPVIGGQLWATGGTGELEVGFTMPPGIPPGTELWVQWAIQDAAAIHGVALSNAILGVTP